MDLISSLFSYRDSPEMAFKGLKDGRLDLGLRDSGLNLMLLSFFSNRDSPEMAFKGLNDGELDLVLLSLFSY